MSIDILIADDHSLFRAGLRTLLNLEAGMNIVAEAATGSQTLRLIEELKPDLLLLDINMPDPDGIEVARQVKQLSPDTQVLMLTAYEDESLLKEAIRSGASGYIVKRALESELIDAIRAVSRGELYVHPAMTHILLKDLASTAVDDEPSPVQLTPREIEVLGLLADGYTNRQIAHTLGISVRTVEGHRSNLTGKLGLRSRLELVRYAKKHNLIP